ncbi:MAG: hypothetical protein OJF55_000371 [Rhodanobacteraceae bacterium]|nr:MAG: hypothetical protein OJF55_000371 [Rhodanobacteraceae bacterium]
MGERIGYRRPSATIQLRRRPPRRGRRIPCLRTPRAGRGTGRPPCMTVGTGTSLPGAAIMGDGRYTT